MAIERHQKAKLRPSLIKSILMNTLCTVFFGWIILTVWCLTLWVSQGFEAGYKAIGDVSARQAFISKSASPASSSGFFTTCIQTRPGMEAHQVFGKVQAIREDITEKAAGRIMDFTGSETIVPPVLEETLEDLKMKGRQFLILAQAAAELLFIRLCITLTAIPLFMLAIMAGLVDGLSQRAIRTASLGRESTWVFHQSIPVARKILFLILALWLAMPVAIHPSPLFVGLAVLMGLLSSVTASRFKKYL